MVEAIEEIRWWFEAGGYEVSERVGHVGGEIDRFAVQRRGIRPPVIWWTATERFPDDLGAALDALEEGRRVRGADQALVVVMGDDESATPHPDLGGRAANYVTLRYLALHLSGVLDEQRRLAGHVSAVPSIEKPFSDEGGDEVDGRRRIERWLKEESSDVLILAGESEASVEELLVEVAAVQAQLCLEDPRRNVPITLPWPRRRVRALEERLLARRWVVCAEESEEATWGCQLRRVAIEDVKWKVRCGGSTPGAESVMAWFRAVAPRLPSEPFRAVVERDAGFRRMLLWPGVRATMCEIVNQERAFEGSAEMWAASVLSRCIQRLVSWGVDGMKDSSGIWSGLEDGSLRSFALGAVDVTETIDPAVGEKFAQRTAIVTHDDELSDDYQEVYLFTSTLVRDWFLARKVAREVRVGNLALLTRYVFPQEHVGLFLAVLAPDVASLVGADRSEALRREIEAEVARKVQLTLGHQLNRAIGALGAHVRTVRRTFRDEALDNRTRTAFTRIDEELDHLRRLTERSRLLDASASPWELLTVPLEEAVSAVAEPLRQRHPDIAIDVAVAADLAVRAAPEGLREVIHCVLENAFHSVGALPEGRSRTVGVSARRDGETVRLRVRDNGTGVRPEDQERIFQPYVTTKTGGPGEPRGTGLGLSIARTFAERMGAQVSLEASNGETVFVMVFVAGR